MINLTTLFLYIIGAAVIIIAPGPDFLYVTARGMAQGRKAFLMGLSHVIATRSGGASAAISNLQK